MTRPTIDEARSWRGLTVVASGDEPIGEIEAIYVDRTTRQPEWALVHTGLYGSSRTFVPLADAAQRGDTVRVPHDPAVVRGAARLEPDAELSEEDEARLYAHYGVEYATASSLSALPAGETASAAGSGGDDPFGDDEPDLSRERIDREAINDFVETFTRSLTETLHRVIRDSGIAEADRRPDEQPAASVWSPTFTAPSRVTIGKEGRITLPALIRSLLGLEEGSQLVVDVDQEHQWLRLRPAVTLPRDQAWAYTPEHLDRVARSLVEVAENRIAPLSEEEVLERIGKAGQREGAQGKEEARWATGKVGQREGAQEKID